MSKNSIMKTLSLSSIVAAAQLMLFVAIFSTVSFAHADKGSSSSASSSDSKSGHVEDRAEHQRAGDNNAVADQKHEDREDVVVSVPPGADDGTSDQGHDDVNLGGTPVATLGNDDGTADQGHGDL